MREVTQNKPWPPEVSLSRHQERCFTGFSHSIHKGLKSTDSPLLAHSTGQEVNLVLWGCFGCTTVIGNEVNVLRSYRAGQREVLEDGGEEKEQFIAGNAFSKTNALSCGHKGQVM